MREGRACNANPGRAGYRDRRTHGGKDVLRWKDVKNRLLGILTPLVIWTGELFETQIVRVGIEEH